MSKRAVMVLILVAVLAAVLLVYILIPKENNVEPIVDPAANSQDKIIIAQDDYQKVSDVSYTYNDKKLSFDYNGNTGKWYYRDYKELPIDQTKITAMAAAISSIAAERLVEESKENFATYGLDEPFITVTINYTDGISRTYNIGNYNSFGNTYYFNVGDTDSVYMIVSALIDYFKFELFDLITLDTIPNFSLSTIKVTDCLIGEVKIPDYNSIIDLIKANKLGALLDYTNDEKYGITDNSQTVTIEYNESVSVTNEEGSLSSKVQAEKEFDFTVGNGCIKVNSSGLIYSMDEAFMNSINEFIK